MLTEQEREELERLRAANAELLEVCEAVIANWDDTTITTVLQSLPAIERMRAAIAKAKGE